MKTAFVDTHYWIAVANPRDQWHSAAMKAGQHIARATLITTDEVLSEFLAFFAARGMYWRREAVKAVREIGNHSQIEVIPQTRDSFLDGLALYEDRLDKDYSLTDCISMAVMRDRGIAEVLTHDHYFEQEGFKLLLTPIAK